MTIIDRRDLWRAPWPNVLRLARSLGIRLPRGCACVDCKLRVIEAVARRCA